MTSFITALLLRQSCFCSIIHWRGEYLPVLAQRAAFFKPRLAASLINSDMV